MTIIDKLMNYLTEYAYGNVGVSPARKLLITGKVEVFHVDRWIKCTKKAAKDFVAAAVEEEAAPPAPKSLRKRAINAANMEALPAPVASAPEAAQNGADPLPVIDVAGARKRSEEAIKAAMAEQMGQPPGEPLSEGEEEGILFPPGDPELFCQKVEAISDGLDKVQFSSASGYRDLQELRTLLREAIAEFRGEQPQMEELDT